MATILYRLSGKTDKDTGLSEILVRFFHGSLDQRAKTNIFVDPEYWNSKTQRNTIPRFRLMTEANRSILANINEQNSKIEKLSAFIQQSFIDDGAGKVSLPSGWLAAKIHGFNFPHVEERKSFFDVYEYFIETRELSDSRRKHFKVDWRALKRFSIYYDLDLDFDNFTSDTLRSFEDYLSNEHTFYRIEGKNWRDQETIMLDDNFARAYKSVPESRLPQPRGKNAIYKIMQEIRVFYKWALKNKYTSSDPYSDYEIGQCLYGTPYYLNIEERNHLYKFDFSDNPRLAAQRDIFVFQCVIGCRVSDLTHLTKASIINGAVEYIPRKTKDGKPFIIRVPLNSIAREIVERYKDIPGDALLPCHKFDSDYNDDIKEMCRLANLDRIVTILNPTTREEEKRPIWEVASSHMARRCFIGNLYKQVKDPNLVGKLSGHVEGSKAFARYRDIDEEMTKELVTLLEG